MPDKKNLADTRQMLTQIAEIDELKGKWSVFTEL